MTGYSASLTGFAAPQSLGSKPTFAWAAAILAIGTR
jgi:hypothetical protein